MKRLSGLIAAPYTPLQADGRVAFDVIRRQSQSLTKNRVSGAFICGTTGEGASLTGDERRHIAETWAAARAPQLRLIVHVGHSSIEESRQLARHAAKLGVDAIATIAPSFFRSTGTVELVEWCREVAAAAPNVPFYYYHMPALTGSATTATAFLERADGRIPTLAGVKFTHEDLMDFSNARRFKGGLYNILFGRDEILFAGLALGAQGAVGSTYNFAAPLYHRIWRAFSAGNLAAARREQAKAMALVGVLHRHGGLSAGKALMKAIGIDCGPVRLPLRALTSTEQKLLGADLKRLGFFTSASRT